MLGSISRWWIDVLLLKHRNTWLLSTWLTLLSFFSIFIFKHILFCSPAFLFSPFPSKLLWWYWHSYISFFISLYLTFMVCFVFETPLWHLFIFFTFIHAVVPNQIKRQVLALVVCGSIWYASLQIFCQTLLDTIICQVWNTVSGWPSKTATTAH